MLKVFLDCSGTHCFDDYLRDRVELVEYVRDRADADVHVLVTRAQTGSRGQEYTLSFIGLGAFTATTRTLTVTAESTDSEDRVRRSLASALTVGLLAYVAPTSVPADLEVSAQLSGSTSAPVSGDHDPWKRWIFSLNGNAQLRAEESQRDRHWRVSVGADRITPEWKLTVGANVFQSRQEFDLDEDQPLAVERNNRSVNWLGVRALGEHWSAGLRGGVRSSTFDNIQLDIRVAPAVEWNFFPYSVYTRRQLRVLYSLGGSKTRYFEETLFEKLRETRARQELSGTYEQREPWGTVEGRVELSNYFPGFTNHRVSVDTEVDIRVARGLSLSLEASASRIRDRLSLPRRDATAEEVLLRLRQLSSGFETRVEFGFRYQFGSRFASIVNPRFGQ
ncbi:MAG TPA: hypothetical protein VNJ02_01760 [Vicinamibacterales bacterium]|nr:hypothetical protein [Vicinamibacterales bacterium]